MSEMLGRVTKAVRTYGVRIWGAPHLYAVIKASEWDKPIISGMSCEIAHQEAAKLNARAAIEAMREPTENMLFVGSNEDAGYSDSDLRISWQLMIDEALK